ncbi:MAG: lipopolysaccharide biosynthesis protein [bacterium]|nr:lipopolysaccharide biosynthesis protein [bacterium]
MGEVKETPPTKSRRERLETYLWLYLARGLVLITGILVFRWASTILGADSFSEYAMSRRTISLLAPAMMLGLGVGLPRRIAMLVTEGEQKNAQAYFWAAASFLLISNGIVFFLVWAFPGQVATLFFGDSQHQSLIFPMTMLLAGLSWHNIIWAFLRGRFFFREASILEIINLVIAPVTSFLVFNQNTAQLLQATGTMVLGVCFLVSVFWAFRTQWNLSGHWQKGRELLSYGLPRVPGDFALGGLIAIPSLLAAHMFDLKTAGYVAFASTMLNLAGTSVAPLSTALLPEAAKLIRNGQKGLLKREIKRLTLVAAIISVIGVIVAEIWMPTIIKLYLGPEFSEVVPILRGFALCVLPYIQFVVLRSVVDAAHHKPINTINLLIALVCFVVATFVFGHFIEGIKAILTGALVGHSILFILTYLEIRKIFKPEEEGEDVASV